MSEPPSTKPAQPAADIPKGNAAGFGRYLQYDLLSGFLVFLIALPLCLGISLASGYPPLAGIFTAIIGSLVTTLLSNAELTIKGPAAGLIVIAIGCITDFGGDGMLGGFTEVDQAAYRAALAVGVAAAVLQIFFAVFRAGILGEFFPTATVHGMLAAIGVIIMIKQFPVALGVTAKGAPLEMLQQLPNYVMEANPAIAAIGLVSLAIMFLWPMVKNRVGMLGAVPAPVIVLVVAVAMGTGFDLLHKHSYVLSNHKYQLGEQYLVAMPDHMFGMFDQITFPDMTALAAPKAWTWVFMFFAVGSLETLLSAKAVDLLDPWKRKTNMNRDVLAVGVANLGAAMVGGLPMITEIVRSKANIDNGARTRFAGLWHGLFLLLCVALLPTVLHRIPLAALAAMLVYTGSRLAHPNEFLNAWRIGKEQLAIFCTTIVAVLATDLLMGIGIGVLFKLIIHVANGVPLSSMFKPFLEVEDVGENTSRIVARGSAVFSNWIPFRRQIEQIGLVQRRNIVVDLAEVKLVDHTVLEKLHELEADFDKEGLRLELVGLDGLQQLSSHALSARRRGGSNYRRLTAVIGAQGDLNQLGYPSGDQRLIDYAEQLGAVACARWPCELAIASAHGPGIADAVRVEVVLSEQACDKLAGFIRRSLSPDQPVQFWIDTVEAPLGDLAFHPGKETTSAPAV